MARGTHRNKQQSGGARAKSVSRQLVLIFQDAKRGDWINGKLGKDTEKIKAYRQHCFLHLPFSFIPSHVWLNFS